jgi:hypothetical protein
MVFNTTRHIKLPMRNATIRSHTGRMLMKGEGAGGVLLQLGGAGGGSSYADLDDYMATTGINPYARAGVSRPSGSGLGKKISEKLSKLSVIPDGVKRKNITMSF